MDVDALWEYGDPEESESRFRAALPGAAGDAELEILTQIARALGMRGRFEEAEQVLADLGPRLAGSGPAPTVRWLLERGRVLNSSGSPGAARPLFVEAWEAATAAGLVGLAVDAAHMVAIVDGEPGGEWAGRGLDLAASADDPKAVALLPAMLNNAAWDHHEAGKFEEALELFRRAEDAWLATGREPQGRIARWSVARCLRSLGRHDEALEVQYALEREGRDDPDGYVFEEIAESLLATGRVEESRLYFRRAAEMLGGDEWLATREPGRLERLRHLGG